MKAEIATAAKQAAIQKQLAAIDVILKLAVEAGIESIGFPHTTEIKDHLLDLGYRADGAGGLLHVSW